MRFQSTNVAISWSNTKQKPILQFSAEAKYTVVREATKEALWLWHILEEMGGPQPKPMRIFCASQSCMVMAKHLQFHGHSKHIKVWVHFIGEKVETRELESRYCPTTNVRVMDIFPKSLPYPKLGFCKENLEVSNSTPTKAIDEFFKEQMSQ